MAWEPTVAHHEKQKRAKYEALAADMATQWKNYRVAMIPLVIGSLGLITGKNMTAWATI